MSPIPPTSFICRFALVLTLCLGAAYFSQAATEDVTAGKWLPGQAVTGDAWRLEFTLPRKDTLPDAAHLEVPFSSPDKSLDTGCIELYRPAGEDREFVASSVFNVQKAKVAKVKISRAIRHAIEQGADTIVFDLVVRRDDALASVMLQPQTPPVLKLGYSEFSLPVTGPLAPGNPDRQVIAETAFVLEGPVGEAFCPLLFPLEKVETVFNSLTGEIYDEPADYIAQPDGLRIPPGSRIDLVKESLLYSKSAGIRAFPLRDGRSQLAPEGDWWNQRQIAITYRAATTFDLASILPDLALQRSHLSGVRTRLAEKKPVTFLVFGDSISVGGNASSQTFVPPFLHTWSELLAEECGRAYGTPVTLKNYSLGGKRSDWGRAMAPVLLRKAPADLVIIAFGMNDRNNISRQEFQSNIEAIIGEARAANPEVDILLVSSMQPNPLWGNLQHIRAFRQILHSLTGPGIALADMTAVSEFLLGRKRFIDLTANGVNHPNDYLVRWYAATLGALLLPD